MSIVTCPTDVVAAPAERIWRLVTHPAEIARWAGVRPIAKPARSLAAGDRAVFRVRLGLYVRFEVLEVDEPRQLRVDIACRLA